MSGVRTCQRDIPRQTRIRMARSYVRMRLRTALSVGCHGACTNTPPMLDDIGSPSRLTHVSRRRSVAACGQATTSAGGAVLNGRTKSTQAAMNSCWERPGRVTDFATIVVKLTAGTMACRDTADVQQWLTQLQSWCESCSAGGVARSDSAWWPCAPCIAWPFPDSSG